ncbi:MAG TPA: fatty acid--CoA ligase family protein [Actinomycetota bacterium]|nr:fatty acid--CoA ligase family protein [Actinomycetota bacterium]
MTISAAPGELVAIDLLPGPRWTDVVEELWGRGVAFLPLDSRLTERERRAIVDRAAPALILGEDEETWFADGVPVDERIGVVVATSGTSGAPKLAELSRSAVRSALEISGGALALEPQHVWVACLPPAHVGGLLALLRGVEGHHPLQVHARFDPARVVAAAPCWVSVVPTMVRRLVADDLDLSGLSLLVGGGALDPALRAAAEGRGATIVGTYGLTESCGGIAYDGRLLAGTRARLDSAGAIELRGPTLMEGYRHDPQATADAFTVEGWLRTGDVGRIADDGTITVDGRADEAIRSGGERIWPDEVESVLRDHPKVADAAVAGRPDPEWGSHVAAWIVPARIDDPPSLEELRRFAKERVAAFKAPREVFLVPDIPRTSSGKIRRHDLPEGRPGTGEEPERSRKGEGPSQGGVDSGLPNPPGHRGGGDPA